MVWPQATDYNAAIQNPRLCFGDDDLRRGQAEGDLFGLPRPYSGSFADVYQLRCGPDQTWAAKCFTRPLADHGALLGRRYQAISAHLRVCQQPFMVDFHYFEEGISVRGQWYPLVKMRWVEGQRLSDFLAQHHGQPAVVERLMQLWLRLTQDLREAGITHGDLQHGNVLLVPGSRNSLALRLIDYDGMYVPALADIPSGEIGHVNYQHPQRLRDGLYGPEVDRFAHLVIYTALHALRVAGPALWQRYDSGENLLFRQEDFQHPSRSRLLAELAQMSDPDLRSLVGHLILASQAPCHQTPLLAELVGTHGVRPLGADEKDRLAAVLPIARGTRVLVPAARSPSSDTPVPGSRTAGRKPITQVQIEAALHRPLWAAHQSVAPASPAAEVPPRGSPGLPSWLPQPQPDLLPGYRPHPLVLVGAGLAILLCLLMFTFLAGTPAGAPSSPSPEPPRPALLPLAPIAMEAGHQRNVLLSIVRNGSSDELAVRVEGLPADVQQRPCLLSPEQEIAPLIFEAGIHAECVSCPVVLSLWQGQRRIAECDTQLTVTPFRLPVLEAIGPIRIEQGEKRQLRLAVQRRGCSSPLRVEVEQLPGGVQQRCLPAAKGASAIVLELAAAADAAPAAGPVLIQLWTDKEQLGEARKVPFTLVEHHVPPRLVARGPVRLKAGGTARVLCEVDGADAHQHLRLRLEGLPADVDSDPQPVAGGKKLIAVPIWAAADARQGDFTIKVLALEKDKKAAECEVALAIEAPEPIARSVEPREVPRPAVARGPQPRGEAVTLTTVDHALLHATYYRGSEGKKSGCVLLLHDLKKSSADPAWRALAEKLHARGHTVLALDYRGHGESTRVEADFWKEPVNQQIRGYDPRLPPADQPRQIKQEDFPGQYLVWLIHDVVAARSFLELQHEDPVEPVNLRNLVVIGAGQGATVGAVWMETECFRHRMATQPGEALRWDHTPETEVFAGAIWVGLDVSLAGQRMDTHLIHAGQYARLPMVLLYGDSDAITRNYLASIYNSLQRATRRGSSRVHFDLRGVPNTAAARQLLMSKNLKTTDMVCETVNNLLEGRLSFWAHRHFAENTYRWIIPYGGHLIHYMAKEAGEKQVRPVPLAAFDMPMRPQNLPRPLTVGPG